MEKYDDGKSMGIDGLSAFGTSMDCQASANHVITQLWFRVTPTLESPGTTNAQSRSGKF